MKIPSKFIMTDISFANFVNCICTCSPWNSPRQSAIAKGFSKANRVFVVITSAKILLRWLFLSKIYIQFIIFNTYFSTSKRYYLHMLEKCLYALQEVRSIIHLFLYLYYYSSPFFFIHVAMEQALLSHHISSHQRNSVTSKKNETCDIKQKLFI